LQVAEKLCQKFLNSYIKTISEGKAYWMGEDMAPPVIEDLLARKNQVKRRELLEERTVLDQEKQRRSLKIDFKKAKPITDQQRQKVESCIEDFAAQQTNPKFFKLLDVAQRIAGKGSLGIERYVLLVEGKGSPDGKEPYLLRWQCVTFGLNQHGKVKAIALCQFKSDYKQFLSLFYTL
jgi:uncharacterized protein (DUF2252 family)